MTNPLSAFFALAPRQKGLLLQAWFMLAGYRAGLRLFSFKRLCTGMQHESAPAGAPGPVRLVHGGDEAVIIGRLVSAAARVTPWSSRCLEQALVVQRLLAARGIPGHFFLGVRREQAASGAAATLAAHAWVQCGEHVICGAAGHRDYTVVSTLSWSA